MTSYYTKEDGTKGPDGLWKFGAGISDKAIRKIEQGVLAKVSFLILAIGNHGHGLLE